MLSTPDLPDNPDTSSVNPDALQRTAASYYANPAATHVVMSWAISRSGSAAVVKRPTNLRLVPKPTNTDRRSKWGYPDRSRPFFF